MNEREETQRLPGEVVETYCRPDPREVVEVYTRPLPGVRQTERRAGNAASFLSTTCRQIQIPPSQTGTIPPRFLMEKNKVERI